VLLDIVFRMEQLGNKLMLQRAISQVH